MAVLHNLGFPRIGLQRELKRALEAYWRGELDQSRLEQVGRELRERHWALQAEAGIQLLPVGDFSFYDHVLDMSCLLGVVPERFGAGDGAADLDTYFRMARGRAPTGEDAVACELTKWFDTNYHYLVPELAPEQRFSLHADRLLGQIAEAQALGHRVKAVLLGPLTFLALAKPAVPGVDKLGFLDALLPVYGQLLERLRDGGVEWVQLDEPILVTELDRRWQQAFEHAYNRLQLPGLKRLLATYFDGLGDNLHLAASLPVDGLHIDVVRAPEQLEPVLDRLPGYKVLSLGVVDGRNVWRADLGALLDRLEPLAARLGERLWLAPSCSLLHVPVDAAAETALDPVLQAGLAFAVQKLDELRLLRRGLAEGREAIAAELAANREALSGRQRLRTGREDGRRRVERLDANASRRSLPYAARAPLQRAATALPLLPTTTIGSFPQTAEIRAARAAYRRGEIDAQEYTRRMQEAIAQAVREQEAIGLDVLVHGEAERNDMVEYFGEQLEGFAFTANGWVQSYGSRCVKPPIIYADVSRPRPMTVAWTSHAQSLTDRPMKGMLTGPVTLLHWSFVRDDQPRSDTCRQLALALRDEVADLEAAGIRIIQIDEPAFREGLPLKRSKWAGYLQWAGECFRLAAGGADPATQIHTHMCYSEFNDIIDAIAALDADVITIETARSHLGLLDAFAEFAYPGEIGPGVWDIHSPRVPSVEEMVAAIESALRWLPAERLWVNPDCGLKTRDWSDVRPALANMVSAARIVRERLTGQAVAGSG